MKINTANLAAQLAHTLDESDRGGKDGKIEASVWNNFVSDKGGKTIKRYININRAIRSLAFYLYRQAKEKSCQIKVLGEEWINNVKQNKTPDMNINEINNSKKNSARNKVDTSYSELSRENALKKAEKDPRLEKLNGGDGWSISAESFITDIPYARKYTGAILSFVSAVIGEHITVTSALGTGGSKGKRTPHVKRGYKTHHNAENPKLDIRTNGHASKLRRKLAETGLFSRVSVEPDHLDIQIKEEVYIAFEKGYSMNKILAQAKNNSLENLMA